MIGYRTIAAAGIYFAALAVATPSSAQMIASSNPEGVASYFRAEGATVVITTDSEGDPRLQVMRGENLGFEVWFYNCINHKNCQSLQFYAGYSGADVDATRINIWNRTRRFGRAYLDTENNPAVEMDINMLDPGISRALFADNYRVWKVLMSEFSNFIYGRR